MAYFILDCLFTVGSIVYFIYIRPVLFVECGICLEDLGKRV
jgi:hypothetical protein